MSKPLIRIHNTEIDEVIDREMTDEEFDAWQLAKAEADAKIAELENLAVIKNSAQAKLQNLGLTTEEINALKN